MHHTHLMSNSNNNGCRINCRTVVFDNVAVDVEERSLFGARSYVTKNARKRVKLKFV